jgi:hypothetical protein
VASEHGRELRRDERGLFGPCTARNQGERAAVDLLLSMAMLVQLVQGDREVMREMVPAWLSNANYPVGRC